MQGTIGINTIESYIYSKGVNMLLTVKTKLITNREQHDSLLKTMEKFNEACNFISVFAFKKKDFWENWNPKKNFIMKSRKIQSYLLK